MAVILIIVLVLAFILGQAAVYRKKWNRNLKVSVGFSVGMTGAGDDFEIIETAENDKWLPVPSLMIKYSTDRNLVVPGLVTDENENIVTDKFYYSDAVPVLSHKKSIKKLVCHSKKRGVFTVDSVYLSARDLCYTEEFHSNVPADASILIYPAYLNFGESEFPFNHMMGDILTRLRFIEDPFEFRGLRDYLPQDATNRINWKASAKSDDYIVNEFNQTVLKTIRIYVNLTQNSGHFEDALIEEELKLLVSISSELLNRGFTVGVSTNAVSVFGDRDINVELGTGRAHMEKIHEASAVVDASAKVGNFAGAPFFEEFKDNGDFVILIGFDQSEELQDGIRERVKNGYGTYWILPVNGYVKNEVSKDINGFVYEWGR